MLQERNLDLKKCIDLSRSSEAASSQIKNISGASGRTDDVHQLKVQPTKPPWKQKYDHNAKHHKHQKRKNCKFCAGNHPWKKELHPAWQKRHENCTVITVEPSTHAIEQTSGYAREIHTEMMINDKKT